MGLILNYWWWRWWRWCVVCGVWCVVCGVWWCGVVWCGVVWCGVVWVWEGSEWWIWPRHRGSHTLTDLLAHMLAVVELWLISVLVVSLAFSRFSKPDTILAPGPPRDPKARSGHSK